MEGTAKLWDSSETSAGPLRRPKGHGTSLTNKHSEEPSIKPEVSSSSIPNSTTQVDIKGSKLSADAQEWFPSNYTGIRTTPPLKHSSVQDRLSIHKKSKQNEDKASSMSLQNVEKDIARLRQLIDTLTTDPGQFDMLIDIFMESIRPYYDDIEVLSLLAEILLNQAVHERNFAYTSARLCSFIEHNCPLFRSELHLKCSKALNENVQLQGLTMFLAELYLQLQYENLYGKCLLDALSSLLNTRLDADTKCACQVLKLTGHSLEMYNSQALDEIFSKLQGLRASLSPSVANCLNSVVKLRNEAWGTRESSAHNNDVSSSSDQAVLWTGDDGTVFYGPINGLDLSAEERMFVATHIEGSYNLENDELSDPDELCDPEPEMDEEIQAAFKEFLRLSKK